MASYASIRARQTAAPVFAQARTIEHDLSCAIALDTIFSRRLRTLRGYVKHALREHNAQEMARFLDLYGPCFESTIASAERDSSHFDERRVA